MRRDIFRPLGLCHSPLLVENNPAPRLDSDGCGKPIHPWCLVLFRQHPADHLRLSVGGQMAKSHGAYPNAALPDRCSAWQIRRSTRPVHTSASHRGVSAGRLLHRRIPKRPSSVHHRIIRSPGPFLTRPRQLSGLGDPSFQSGAGSVRGGLTSRPVLPSGSFLQPQDSGNASRQ